MSKERRGVTRLGCLLVYVLPFLIMTGALFGLIASARINRSSLGPFDLTLAIAWAPMRHLLDDPLVALHLVAIGLYLVFPRRWSGVVSALAIASWYWMAFMNAIGLFD